MRRILPFCLLPFCLALLTTLTSKASAVPLAGTYTIGTGGTYATVAAAVNDLLIRGVSAPVTFQIKTGTYAQQLAINGVIAGASAANRVRFVAQSGNAADVVLQSPAVNGDLSDAVVVLTGAQFVNVEQMTLQATGGYGGGAAVVGLRNGATDDRVLNCVMLDATESRSAVTAGGGATVDRLELRHNQMNGFYYGVLLSSVSAANAVIEGNKLTATNASYGIYLSSLAGAGVLVANNFVATGGGYPGIQVSYNQDVALYHNSVNMLGIGQAVGVNAGAGNTVTLKNNVFACPGGGNAAFMNISGATVTTDYNDYYTSGSALAYWNSGYVADLAALRIASGQDTHSISGNPGFVSSTDLHTHLAFLNAAGTPIAAVTTDVDNEARSATTPDIGADEFAPAAALSGTYTIGTGGTYATVAAAVSDLLSRGVSGPVTFQVKTGTYAQPLAINGGIAGASAANRVRFVAQSGNAADVVLQSPAVNPDLSDAVVALNGTRFVNVEQMTLQATGVSGYNAAVVGLRGGATDDRVLNCVMVDASESRSAVTAGAGAAVDRLELRHNQMNGFYYGVYLYNLSAASAVIEGNKLAATNPSYGILLSSLTGAGVLVANNFVALSGGARGIEADYNQDVALYHNSVNVLGSATPLGVALNNVGNTLIMKNNVFANAGGGNAAFVNFAGATVISDYNDYYSSGPVLAYWNGYVADLAALRIASGQDSHSISGNPGFVSGTDLHTHLAFLNAAGTPIAAVTTDIDGEARSVTTPDVGADEFAPAAALSGTYTIGTAATYATLALAVSDAQNRGVSGPVTFQVKTGTYPQLAINGGIAGASTANRVRFVAQSGNAADVVLQSPAVNPDLSDAVVTLNGARFVNVELMTLQATGGAGAYNAAMVGLRGGATDDRMLNCVMADATESRMAIAAVSGGAIDRLELRHNRMTGFYYGVFLSGVSAAGVVIEGNKLAATNSAHGIYMSALTGAGMLVANNFVAVTGGAGSGILMNYNQDVALYHNSVNVLGTGKAVEPNLGSGNILIMKNNVFAAPGGGHAAYVNIAGAPTVTTDYNDYNSSGPVLAFWNANAADLAALRVASGQETHSISGNPGFASSTDLHTHAAFLNAAGTPIAAVTTDIDGEARSVTTPDIGADEFVPVAALSGTYTIGTAATYATLALAVSDLQSRGVSGPVTFQVKNGTYAQQLAITGGVAGASAANRVRFVSQSGNAADVVLQSPAVNPDLSDAVVVLTGTSFVNVEQMTLQATGVNGSGATVVGLRGRATDDRVLNCVLLDASETRFAVTAGSGAVIDRLELRRNQINGFIYGVYLYNASAANMVIEGNKLTATHPSYGLYLVSLTGAGVLVANNFVALTGGASGIEADYNQDVAFYYNSVNGPGTALTANLSGASNNLTMKNNVFARPDGAGYVVYMNVSAGAIVTTDYNDYHAQGPTIAYWNGPRATFTALQAASGQDSHSILFPAGFFSNTDLHTFSSSLDGAGTPIAGITTDIDGQTRNAVHPDIGADEFTRPNADVSDLPTIWQLATPTPNPSATEFGIAFALPSSQIVRITLFDVAGRRVFEPVPARAFEPGRYSVEVPTESLNPGLYFLRVKAGPFEGIRRVVVSRR